MSARRQMGALATLLGVLVLALLLGLLFVSGARRTEPDPDRWGSSSAPAEPRPAAPSSPASDPPVAVAVPAALPAAPDPPGSLRLEGTAVHEDGTPLAGVHFLEMVRGEDGAPEVSLVPSANEKIESDAEGRFELRWKARPAEVLLLVMTRDADLASVGNGAILEAADYGTAVRADPAAGPLRLGFRPLPGRASVRLLDDATGAGIDVRLGFMLSWVRGERRVLLGVAIAEDGRVAGDRIPVKPPPRVHGDGEDRRVFLQAEVPGYLPWILPLEEVHGDLEVRLLRPLPEVYGEVVVAGAGSGRVPVLLALVPGDPGGSRPQEDLHRPVHPGPFSFTGVPDGRWTLEAVAYTPEGPRWARRDFEKAGGAVNLGAVEISSWSGFRVRAVDTDGRPLGTPVSIARVGRASRVEAFSFHDGAEDGSGTLIVDSSGVPRAVGPGARSEEEPGRDPEGWTEIRGLLPGARYRLSVPALGEKGVEVEAPGTTGEIRAVEVRVERRVVRCVLRFTVGGKPPEGDLSSMGGPRLRDAGRGPGVYETELPAGKHALRAFAASADGKQGRVVQGDLDVPDQDTFEATVDLR